MSCRKINRLALVLLAGLIAFSLVSAAAANNVVPVTHLTDQSSIITANSLKPSACSAITLTAILYCPTGPGGVCDGTGASELVIGTAADDNIQGGKGEDCILGGGGSDNLRGEQNTDICLGGPGTDVFHPSCETEVQN